MSVLHVRPAYRAVCQALGELPRLPTGVRMDPRLLTEAACRPLDPDLFFPEPDDEAAVALAKATCWRCPVQARCLEWAKASGDTEAILGGLTPAERLLQPRQVPAADLATLRADWQEVRHAA